MLLAGISHGCELPSTDELQTALLDRKIDTTSLHEDIDEMDALVEMLLVSAQLQSGSFEIRPEPIILQELVFEVLAGNDLPERYISLDVDSSIALRADRLLIKRALLNLCTNVSKYTPEDCTVSIGAKRVGKVVEISVADHKLLDCPMKNSTIFWNPFGELMKVAPKWVIPRWVGDWDFPLCTELQWLIRELLNCPIHPNGLTVLLKIPIGNS